MNQFRTFFFFIIFIWTLNRCDSLPGTQTIPSNPNALIEFDVNPDTIDWRDSASGGIDSVDITVTINTNDPNNELEVVRVSVYEKGNSTLVLNQNLSPLSISNLTTTQITGYQTSFNLRMDKGLTSTVSLVATGEFDSGQPSNSLTKEIPIFGLSVEKAVVENIIVPDTVFIPLLSNTNFRIFSTVTHPVDQSYINNVFVELYDGNNERLGVFRMYNDGSATLLSNNLPSGDEDADDDIYTSTFTITTTNQRDNITAVVYAVDISGNESNRLSDSFVIF